MLLSKFVERNREGRRGLREGPECLREENQSGPEESCCSQRGAGVGLERAKKVTHSAEEGPERQRVGAIATVEGRRGGLGVPRRFQRGL